MRRGPGGAPEYVYADPDFCHCLYVGGPAQYRYFSQLQVQRRIANEQEQAAMMNEDAAMEWSMPRPIVILHDRH